MKKGLTVLALVVGGVTIATASTALAGAQPSVSNTGIVTHEGDLEVSLPGLKVSDSEQESITNSSCLQAHLSVKKFGLNKSEIYNAGVVTIGDWRVSFKRDGYKAAHPSNPAMTLAYYSFGWVVPDTEADLPESIDLFVQQSISNPDPGSSVDRKRLPSLGWSESAVTLRMKTALCLYRAATDAERASLLPAINALIEANMDENRYYGPPRSKPHNHGVMADRELLNAAEHLDRPELVQFTVNRLRTQLDGLYDECGLTHEQSNGYQYFHASLWAQIARRLDSNPNFQREISDQVAKLADAANAVTFPDGFTPRIGNGSMKSTDDLLSVGEDIRWVCPETGWFSWRKKRGDVHQQVIARFGPGTRFHGHADKGAVVWWAKPSTNAMGVAVLADRGLPGKNRDENYDYAVGPTAHATLLWAGGSNLRLDGKATTRKSTTIFRMSGGNSAGSWNRKVQMNAQQTVLRVQDRLLGKAAARPATQNFPLDPVWQATDQVGEYRTVDGLRLNLKCTDRAGRTATIRQSTSVDYQHSEPRNAITVTCTVPKGRIGVTTVLTVE